MKRGRIARDAYNGSAAVCGEGSLGVAIRHAFVGRAMSSGQPPDRFSVVPRNGDGDGVASGRVGPGANVRWRRVGRRGPVPEHPACVVGDGRPGPAHDRVRGRARRIGRPAGAPAPFLPDEPTGEAQVRVPHRVASRPFPASVA